MTELSTSPIREKSSNDLPYGELFLTLDELKKSLESDPAWQKYNLEYDLRTTDWILDKVRNNKSYAQNLYAALCNQEYQRNQVIPLLRDQTWGCSWRSAGGIIANMRQEGDYIDWYCSGMGGLAVDYANQKDFEQWQNHSGYVLEGVITDEIRADLLTLGWLVVE